MKVLRLVLVVVVMSLFFFPVEIRALPGLNSKMALAVIGLVAFLWDMMRNKSAQISRDFSILALFAAGVSLCSLLSITINQTPDNTYLSYIVSFSVWLGAAYAVCSLIKWIHGRIDVRLVLDYLVWVCLIQCILCIVFDSNKALADSLNTYFDFGQKLCVELNRYYGFGALLDVAGLRMAAVLSGIGFFLSGYSSANLGQLRQYFYIVSFVVITIIGNMIARTALVGTGIGFGFIVFSAIFRPSGREKRSEGSSSILTWAIILSVAVLVSVALYNTNYSARRSFRFAFEGFFSLVERGSWEISSNEKLKTMVVFPETIHTWVIGDGYFMNSRYDANYLGDATDQGFYMGTDIGYLRFIFYFGIIGLIPMMGVIVYSAVLCMRYFPEEKLFFLLALAVGLTVWLKVSTDIFLYFALFLSAAYQREPSET